MSHNGPSFVEDIFTEIPKARVSFDMSAFDDAIRSHGVSLVHHQAMPCPVGMTDLDDNRRPASHDGCGCSNGFLYNVGGGITALFTNNNKSKNHTDLGMWDGSTVVMSFPRTYDGTSTPVLVSPFDRFYLAEENLVVITWQRFIHREDSLDRLKYPACAVTNLVDSTGQTYVAGQDFVVVKGNLKWVGDQPAQQLDIGPGLTNGNGAQRGAVCSVRYTYRPWFYVGTLMHELRVAQVTDEMGRSVVRGPQQCLVHREFVVTSKDNQEVGSIPASVDADSFRTVMGPMYGGGSFGVK
jgi:hypothetical protein